MGKGGMKTKIKYILLGFGVFVIFAAGFLLACRMLPRVGITKEQISVKATGDHPANNRQYNASVWMGVFDNQLYIYPHRPEGSKITKYQNWLCRFDNGTLQRIYRLHDNKLTSDRIFAMIEDSVIYLHFSNSVSADDNSIHCFHVRTNTDQVLLSKPNNGLSQFETAFFDGDDLYCPLPLEQNAPPSFLRVHDGKAGELTTDIKGYRLGDAEYFIPEDGFPGYPSKVMCRKGDELQEVKLGAADSRSLIPTECGLLVHNDGGEDLLYLIEESGEVKELFRVFCLRSQSAITVHGSDAYLSVKRYQEWGPLQIGFVRTENDEAEGTYRISLQNGSVEKISGSIYDGLFIFDESGMYACDELCSIYKLDFDGNVIEELMVVR